MRSDQVVDEKDKQPSFKLGEVVEEIRADRIRRRIMIESLARRINIATNRIREIEREESKGNEQ